jgi:small subunit ribosomal protein S1
MNDREPSDQNPTPNTPRKLDQETPARMSGRDRLRGGPRPAPAAPAAPVEGATSLPPNAGKVPRLDENDQGFGSAPSVRSLDDEIEREMREAMLGFSDMDRLMGGRQQHKGPPKTEGPRTGKVISVRGKDVFLDVGGRTQGVLPLNQFPEGPPAIGTEVEVSIEGFDPDGVLILNRGGEAVQEADWSTVAEGMVVEAKVLAANKGGLSVEVNGIRGFIPMGQIDLYRVEHPEEYVNKKLKCIVTEVDREERNLVVSRKGVLERERNEAREQTMATLAEGDIREGIVRSIKPFGAFVDLGGVDALLPIGEMSWTKIKTPEDAVSSGQKLRVKVLKIDPVTRKLTVGLKQLTTGPWELAVANYPPGTVVNGVVTRLAEYGAFVEIEPGLEGLVHVSEISQQRIRHPRDVIKVEQSVAVKVLNVDPQARRMSLSIKAASAKEAEEATPIVEEVAATPEGPTAPPKPSKPRKTPLRGGTGQGGPLFQLPEG